MHGNIILHPSFHQVLDPCLDMPELKEISDFFQFTSLTQIRFQVTNF